MEKLGKLIEKRKKPVNENKNIHSVIHDLANEIWEKSPKLKDDFGFILGRINALGGHSVAYARWQESKKHKDPFKYFVAKW